MVDRNTGDLFTDVIEAGSPRFTSNRKSGTGSGTSPGTTETQDKIQEDGFAELQEDIRKCQEEYEERWKEDDKILQAHQDAVRARMLREHGKIPDLSGID